MLAQLWQSTVAALLHDEAARSLAANVSLWWQGGESVFNRIWQYLGFLNDEHKIGKFTFTIANLIIGLLLLLAAIIISRVLRSVVERWLVNHTHIDPGLQYTLLRLTHYVLITTGILAAFNIGLGADFTSLAVVFTALSVGIGFGLQFIAKDLASGFILLFERPVRVGDFVTVGEKGGKPVEGKVQSINLRTTVVMTNDRIAVIVPNSKFVNESLVNWSYIDRRARISIPISVATDSDADHVTRTLLRAAEGVNHVLADPKPSVQFLGFGDFSLDFRLLVWTDRPRRHPSIKSDINYRINRLFKEAKIEIPNPQRELYVRGGMLQIKAKNGDLIEEAGADEGEEQQAHLTHS